MHPFDFMFKVPVRFVNTRPDLINLNTIHVDSNVRFRPNAVDLNLNLIKLSDFDPAVNSEVFSPAFKNMTIFAKWIDDNNISDVPVISLSDVIDELLHILACTNGLIKPDDKFFDDDDWYPSPYIKDIWMTMLNSESRKVLLFHLLEIEIASRNVMFGDLQLPSTGIDIPGCYASNNFDVLKQLILHANINSIVTYGRLSQLPRQHDSEYYLLKIRDYQKLLSRNFKKKFDEDKKALVDYKKFLRNLRLLDLSYKKIRPLPIVSII